MTVQCADSITKTRVDMKCVTTKCQLGSVDTGNHETEINNRRRSGDIYLVEICAVAKKKCAALNGKSKAVIPVGTISNNAAKPSITSIGLKHRKPGTEEIQTNIQFYDATQRGANGFNGQLKETYRINYEMVLT
jgi:hypothetical protein